MKKLFVLLLVLSLTTPCFAIDEWAKNQPASSANPGDIDSLIQTNNEAIDRLMAYGKFGCQLTYSTVSAITVARGSVVCSNSADTVRRTRTNSSATTVTWSDIDTGAEAASTTYYVYAVADTDAATFTVKISTSSSAPTGVTYSNRLGSFYNNASSNIENVTNLDSGQNIASHVHDGKDSVQITSTGITTVLGAWVSRSNNTIYQAATDGFVMFGNAAYNNVNLAGYTDSNANPTTDRGGQSIYYAGATARGVITMPVKKGDYWKVAGASTVYWIPLGS
jgi:hypothetical protein